MLSAFWTRHAVSIRDVDFDWLDVALAAMARSDWSAFERRLAEGLACAARADLEHAHPSQEAINDAETAFRYDRDLISGADVSAWLDRMTLSVDDWVAYLSRDLLRQRWSDALDDIVDEFAPSGRQLTEAVVAEGICSGVFHTFQQTFASHGSFVLETDAARFRRACDRNEPAPSVDADVNRLAHTHAHWLSMHPAAETAARLSTAVQLETAFTALIDRITSNGRMSEIVDANRLDWLRLELDTLSFPNEMAAREAILCVKEDGVSLHDVAAMSHRAVTRTTLSLDDVEPQHREQLLGADPGQVVGPLAVGDRFEVISLISRTPPALSDPAIAARARQALITVALQHAAHAHVTHRG